MIHRREFIAGLGGAAAWPLAARAQQVVRRVGVLMPRTADSTSIVTFLKFLRDALQKLGWIEDRNLRLDIRYAAGDVFRSYAAELVSLKPDVIVTGTEPATKAVQQLTQTIPIVFIGPGDPVAAFIVKSVARPEGNATRVTNGFSSIGGKRVQLLKEAVPRIERVADLYSPQAEPQVGSSTSIEEAARSLRLQAIRIPYRNAVEFEHAIEAFAANGGVIVEVSALTDYPDQRLFGLMVEHQLPAIWAFGTYVGAGGLMSYGGNVGEIFSRAASLVDRTLRGAKPGDLPVEYPTKFDLIINLKAAKAIGITFPPTLRALADEVIE
jgi:putative ABC transport system substrate-binding protein